MTLTAGVAVLLLAAFPYVVYLAGITFGRRSAPASRLEEFPFITLIMAAYNEGDRVEKRIKNIAASSYPSDRLEVIFIDDCSTDDTLEAAEKALVSVGLLHTVLKNDQRMGTNRSYNRALTLARNDIIVSTDANKFFSRDALELVVERLMSDPAIAAVCGDQRPSPLSSESRTGRSEGRYRSVYGRMCDWESAVDATYNFNGPLVAFKKSVIPRIEERWGADDANTAFEAIRKGYRSVYEINAGVYEQIPPDLRMQYRQKIRRAARLIQATLGNLDLLKSRRPFSRIFYPLRIFMYLFSPVLFLLGAILATVGIFSLNWLAGVGLCAGFGLLILYRTQSLPVAFVLNQFYLLAGLLHLRKDMRVWESSAGKPAR